MALVIFSPSTTIKSADINANFAGLADGSLITGQYLNKIPLYAPQGFLINGKISVTVASNNITVVIKTLAGADPSATDPVYVRIGDTVRSITAVLSVTKNAGTNWFNAGSAELATKEVDYFAYLGYNATDGITIGFARIPYANKYSDFSTTATAETYCAISTITNAAANDNYEVIGRFAATLSAGAGYTWTVPTFTPTNLIQRPIYETRVLSYAPTYGGFSANPTVGSGHIGYKIINNICHLVHNTTGSGTSNSVNFTISTPISANVSYPNTPGLARATDNTVALTSVTCAYDLSNSTFTLYKDNGGGSWTASGGKNARFVIDYPI